MNIALPIDGLNILWRVIAVALTLYLSLIIKWVNGSVLQRSVIYQVLFLLALLDVAVLITSPMMIDILDRNVDWPQQILLGGKSGLIGGALLGLWLVALETVNQVGYRFVDMRKVTKIPEEEFVQSAVWALSTFYPNSAFFLPDMNSWEDWADSPEQRKVLVRRLNWLARVLEISIPKQLAKLDPRNATSVQMAFHRRAAILHRWKLELLLGDKSTGSSIAKDIWNAGIVGVSRRWYLLPEGEVDTASKERLARRIWKMVKRSLPVLVLTGGVVASLLAHQTQLALTLAVITTFFLLDLLSPGSGSKIAEAAGSAKMLPDLPFGRSK